MQSGMGVVGVRLSGKGDKTMDGVKALTAEWGEAVYNARENWTASPHEHIERLITAGDALIDALAAPRPQPDDAATLVGDLLAKLREWSDEDPTDSAVIQEFERRASCAAPRPSGEPCKSCGGDGDIGRETSGSSGWDGRTCENCGGTGVARPCGQRAWLIETHRHSVLHYWTGRIIKGKDAGQWSDKPDDARRFARREDADCMITWHLDGVGRAVEHLWMEGDAAPQLCRRCGGVPAATAGLCGPCGVAVYLETRPSADTTTLTMGEGLAYTETPEPTAAPREREAPADLVALLRVVVDAIRAGDMCSDVYGCGCDVSEAWHQLSELVDGHTARPSPPGERPKIEVGDWVRPVAGGPPERVLNESEAAWWEQYPEKVGEVRKPNGVVWRKP